MNQREELRSLPRLCGAPLRIVAFRITVDVGNLPDHGMTISIQIQ